MAVNPVERCTGRSWSVGMRPCKNRTRRRHPSHPDKPLCYTHGGI